jgi:hypothetical protein
MTPAFREWAMSRSLLPYRNDIHSQNGEDGVLAEILKRLGIQEGWCVEFGAWDGQYLSNTFALTERGWQAVYLEGDRTRYEDLRVTTAAFSESVTTLNAYVAAEGDQSLDVLLSSTELPRDFDVLSIDIDGDDWHVWRGLGDYRPKVVIVEIDSSVPPGTNRVASPGCPGSSFTSTVKLGLEKGYRAVCHTGNLFFVREDLVPAIGLPPDEITHPQQLFIDNWVRGNPLGTLLSRVARTLVAPIRRRGSSLK